MNSAVSRRADTSAHYDCVFDVGNIEVKVHTIFDRFALRHLLESDDPKRRNIFKSQVVIRRILHCFTANELLPELE